MKKTYTRKQIQEAIKYWKGQLRKMNESGEGETYTIKFFDEDTDKKLFEYSWECEEGDQSNSDGIYDAFKGLAKKTKNEYGTTEELFDMFEDFGITETEMTEGGIRAVISPDVVPGW